LAPEIIKGKIEPELSLITPSVFAGIATPDLASGDFNKDGIDDLTIGVVDEYVGSIERAGAVNVIYGSSGSGLKATGNQFWHQNTG
jgi:hypothetical protein